MHHDDIGSLIQQRHEGVLHEAQMRRLAKQANSSSHELRLSELFRRATLPLLRRKARPVG